MTDTKQTLQDRVILITGAGDGLGRATALACARQGAHVVLLGEVIHPLEQVYDQIESETGTRPTIYPLNLEGASPKDYDEMAQKLEKEYGHLDGLVHNAAILGALSPVQSMDIELWYRTIQINLNAPFMMTQACLGLLAASDDASIVFVSDDVGRKSRAYWGAYSVSKFGLEALMQMLADELETNTNIRANSYNPGPLRTRMRTLAYPGEIPENNPLPEDKVEELLFLLGPDSKDINGQAR
ncbi:MAG TPA: YciK family oxidoreductase [Gammaproteobacteria bacterium]|nr:YciK family oxidoreductase [Gammaproteobacteria bacterium]